MKRHWRTRRQLLPQLDGQRRWDRAYQLLLGWTGPSESAETAGSPQIPVESPTVPARLSTQEVEHASGHVCARLDTATGARRQR
jgi:hypothetical protein